MTRRRKPKCGLSGSAAEHAAEFQTARHEALDAIHDAQHAMVKQKCLIAGKRIDDGYVAIGKMQASAQTGAEMAEASRVHGALEKADEPFEASCVRDTPIAPAMARKDGASALFQQNAGLADVTGHGLTHLEFDRATVSFHEDGSDWFVAQNIGVYARTADTLGVVLNGRGDLIAGTMAVASARSRLAQRDRLVVELDSPGRVRANFAWVRLSLRDAEALSVWLDNLEAQGLAGISPAAALIAASIPMGVPGVPFMGLGTVPSHFEFEHPATAWFQPFGGPDIPMGGRLMFKRIEPMVARFNDELRFHFTAEWSGDLTITARVLADRWRYALSRGSVLGFVYTVDRQWLGGGERSVHENGILSDFDERDRQRLMVWLDALAENGLAGLGAQRDDFIERAAVGARARADSEADERRFAPELDEDEEASAPPKYASEAEYKAAVAAARARADEEEAAAKGGRPRAPRPASDNLDKFKRSIIGASTGPKLTFMVTAKNDDPILVARRVREFPEVLVKQRGNAEPVLYKLVNADEDTGMLDYQQTTAAALMREKTEQSEPKRAAKRVVKVTPKAVTPKVTRKGLPAAEQPQVDPFQPQVAPQEAFSPRLPAELPAPKVVAPPPPPPEYKEGSLPMPQRRAGPEPIAPSELERFFFAANAGAGFSERLYRIPRVKEDASPLEKLHQQQVSIALMPTSLTHEGQLFVRGQSFTLPAGKTVISYRANTDTGAFVPHFPTDEQRKANDALILDLLTRDRAPKTRPEFDKAWTDADPRTILQLSKPEAVRIRTKGAMEFWPVSTTRFILAHKPRAEMADLTFTAGRGYELKVPMTVLREASVQPNGLEFEVKHAGRAFIVTLPPTQANELKAWLGKSANAGLGAVGAELPDQLEVSADAFSYFELGTHTAVFDTPLRVTFSVGGPNHIVFIDVAARDSRTQLHRRGAFKVLGAFEPEFRQRGTARGLSEQRYSDPAHLSFQLTPSALARLQVWLDGQEERGALFGLGSQNYVSEAYHPVFMARAEDFDAEETFITPTDVFPTSIVPLERLKLSAVRSGGGFMSWLAVALDFSRYTEERPERRTRFESRPNVRVDAMLAMSRARNERVWAFTDWRTNQTVTVKLTDKAYAEFQVWLDQALSEPL